VGRWEKRKGWSIVALVDEKEYPIQDEKFWFSGRFQCANYATETKTWPPLKGGRARRLMGWNAVGKRMPRYQSHNTSERRRPNPHTFPTPREWWYVYHASKSTHVSGRAFATRIPNEPLDYIRYASGRHMPSLLPSQPCSSNPLLINLYKNICPFGNYATMCCQ
jgi:hypothetical protein